MANIKLPKEQLIKEIEALKKENERLKKGNIDFNELINFSNDASFLVDPDTAKIICVNDEACNKLGYSRDELLQLTIMDIDPVVEDKDYWDKHLDAIKKSGKIIVEGRHLRKDKQTFPVEVSVKLIDFQDKLYIVGVARDITERKKAELELENHRKYLDELVKQRTLELTQINERLQKEIKKHKKTEKALKDSEKTSKALLNAPGETAFLIDTQYTVLAINKTAAKRLNKTQAELLGTNIFNHIPKDIAKKRIVYFEQLLKTGKPVYFEDKREGMELSHRIYPVFDSDGKINRIAIYASDITKLKEAEYKLLYKLKLEDVISSISSRFINISVEEIDEEIRSSLKIISEIAEVDRGYIFLFDEEKSYMSMAYEWFYEGKESRLKQYQNIPNNLYTWMMDQFTRHKHIEMDSVQDFLKNNKEAKILLSSEMPKSYLVVPMIYGKELIGFMGFSSSEKRLTWTDEIVRYLKIIGEIFTHALSRKQTEVEQRYLISVLESTNKELQDFAHIVSHELKRPLGTARLQLSSLIEDYKDRLSEDCRNRINPIAKKLDLLNDLINKILNYSIIGWVDEEMVEVNLNESVQEAFDNLNPPKEIPLIFENPLPHIWFEETRILMVFENLLSNAVKNMNREDGEIKVGCIGERGYWKFWVMDNGRGIEKENRDKIFRIFQKLNHNTESTGIGLALVKKVIEMYEGKVWVESTPGEGSIFYFTLPK